jgi:nicotinic acetylcholine receptor
MRLKISLKSISFEDYVVVCDKDAKRLLEDLLVSYDTIVRPVMNPNDQIKLSLGVKLSQIADIVVKSLIFKIS